MVSFSLVETSVCLTMMPRHSFLLLWCLPSLAMSKMMVMSGGDMMKNKDMEDVIASHGLKIPSKRPIRDLDNHLDNSLQPLPPGVQPPADLPEGFDLSTVEAQEDGQFCVFKKLSLEGIEKIPVQQCVHKVDKQCYFSYVTQYTHSTEVYMDTITVICTEHDIIG